MTWSAVGGYGSDQNKDIGVDLTIFQPDTAVAAGSVIIVTVACDNTQTTDGVSNTTSSVIGNHSGTFTKALEYTNGAGAQAEGVACSIWYKRLSTTLAAGTDEITITFPSSLAAKAAYAYIFSNTGGFCNLAAAVGSANDVDPAAMTISGLTSREYLFIRAVATERGNFGYSPSTSYIAFGQNTTTSPGTDTDVAIGAEYRILTATGDTTDPTTGLPESASVYIALYDTTSSLTVNVTGVSATGSLGTITTGAANRPAATGVSATGSVGAVSISGKGNVTVSTVVASGLLGTATSKVNKSTAVTGLAATASVGSVVAANTISVPVTGVAAASAVGSTTQSGKGNVTPTGVSASGAVGSILGSVPNIALLTGLAASTSLGTIAISARASTTVTGTQASALLGSVGNVSGTAIFPLAIGAATGHVGAVTPYQPNTKVAINDLSLSGMRLSLGAVGVRAWGLVNDSGPGAWNDIQTME